ncbi:AGR352Cp [Eremothecium gossypii ATCC 10895]|uniref:AGR352Cp n=1 Tax=Eremothecium gossypii (strain ATCC 10895 / CBS 109.51 / FGSC 9923 / NRRL Y-1056) TaxID=284811 RepID=Q74Z54_EREGS|nr:AGR352Cp [Eremothecium gossypii ATCC 10895]AAS54842.1 AGR352Cp [Eremothecium gossypii ATCC 10895]AEY99174.1 FAGR352Cp [Eremothecium gossypii FDAG1]
MSDPFANLLTKFKGKEKPADAQTSKNRSLNDLLAQHSVSSLSEPPATLYTPRDTRPAAGLVDLGRESPNLPGETSGIYQSGRGNPSTEGYKSQSLIDLEDAQPHPAASVSSFEDKTTTIADEEQDFELAKLMSLGLDIGAANDYYHRGGRYEQLRMRRAESDGTRMHRGSNLGRNSDFCRSRDFGRGSDLGRSGDFERGSDLGRAESSETPQWSSLRSGHSNRLVSAASNLFNRGRDFIEDQLATHARTSASSRSTLSDSNERFSNHTQESDYSVNQTNDQAHLIHTQPTAAEVDLLEGFADTEVVQHQSTLEVPRMQAAGVKSEESLIDFSSEGPSKSAAQLNYVSITPLELSGYYDFNKTAAESYKKGDYHAAFQDYLKSLNTLPLAHPLRIIALSNIITTQLKIGEHTESMKNINSAVELLQDVPFDAQIQDTSPPRTYKEFWQKILAKKAEVLESQDNYEAALSVYQQLISRGYTPKLILNGKARCQKACNSQKGNVSSNPTATTQGDRKNPRKQTATAKGKTEEVKRLKAQNHAIEKQENERFGLHDKVESRIRTWTAGKSTDLRHLLLGLPALLPWLNSDQMIASDLVMPKRVKLSYLKAVSKTHPDKLPQTLELEEKMVAEHVFITLTKAWGVFKEENSLS